MYRVHELQVKSRPADFPTFMSAMNAARVLHHATVIKVTRDDIGFFRSMVCFVEKRGNCVLWFEGADWQRYVWEEKKTLEAAPVIPDCEFTPWSNIKHA